MSATNAKQIAANIRKAAQTDIPNALGKGLDKAGALVAGKAKASCPVDTGLLRNSIQFKSSVADSMVVIGSNVFYAPFVEIGTGVQSSMGNGRPGWPGQRPQPYLKPAVDNNVSAIQRCFEGII